MILDRILKGFWVRYALYLSAFVALYFLMREKLDSIIFGLWDSWITVGVNQYISIFLACLLSCYPAYNLLSKRKKGDTISASPVVFIFIPISVWFIIQKVWTTDKAHYLEKDAAFQIILYFTIIYLIILVLSHLNRHKVIETGQSLLLKDEPIKDENNDKLGFTLYAESISNNIHNIVDNKHSFVFGIEGSWGSGKTSFVNLVKEHLEKHSHIRLLDFNPWMSGSAQQMTTDFFSLMAENTSSMRLRMKFREYGNSLASADGTGIVGKVVESISPSQDLGTMLESINECIVREQLRFVVFIDDTDRLDKEELLAMFKLVRNTACFSNTIFVLTYDRNYVESALTSYFENSSIAEAYTDKIVNFQFRLPSSARDYYEILKEQINSSAFVKNHPDISLKNSDLPKEYTVLFDNLRKVKRVFNALVVESVLPYFEKIPVKFTIIFFYIADYMKEEYEMIREGFNATYGDLQNNRKRQDNETSGKFLLRLIQESKGIYGQTTKHHLGVNDDQILKINEERNKEQVEFERKHPLLYYLLNENRGNNPVVKYLEYLLKYNAIYFKKYKERLDKYGIDGFKGIELKLSNAADILNRILIIRDNFNDIFYRECAYDTFYAFTIGNGKVHIGKNDLEPYFEFLVALSLSTDNPYNSLGSALASVNLHYEKHKNSNANLLAILEKLDETDIPSSDPYIQHYTNFELDMRVYLKSNVYRDLIYSSEKPIFFNNQKPIFFGKNQVIESAINHLKNVINRESNYKIIEDAFLACSGLIAWDVNLITTGSLIEGFDHNKSVKFNTQINKDACIIFRQYIKKFPDEFIENCISKSREDDSNISLHPLLMQIFDNSENEIRAYFNTVICKSEKSQFMLKMINKYLGTYLQIDKEQNPYMTFSIPRKDRISIFDYENMYKSDTNEQ